MKDHSKTAEQQLIQLIKHLETTNNTLNTTELFSVLKATKTIYENDYFIDFIIQSFNTLSHTPQQATKTLTKREKQVVLLIGKGLQNTSIALELGLRKSTVETHRKNIRKKLKLNGTDNLFTFSFLYQLQNQMSQS
ncbi:response regulator transcription factor [Psychroserpens sp. SPM9]|uniref:response regulator transcription factor n=1 Tax=Psychroserpens sp. SPM9 TaxID=2975598 RepID=UPI0021A6575F|nr:LuxR C-terminal-related transcriptional regulator [Psychroserpens sp. SPM9]MDG5492550.1 LuxR C-terminal-related transcriptional regulator [Psychroserpens sp. SPM9]